MIGLALEGGAARGAFHVGVYRALREKKISVKGVVGTSIGAINGAAIAQGEEDLLEDVWNSLTLSDILPSVDERIEGMMDGNLDHEHTEAAYAQIKKLVKNGGVDIEAILRLIDGLIDEERVRQSSVDFGLVTVNVTRRKAQKLFKEDIPLGELTNYLMASSYLPVFKRRRLNGEYYLDGMFSDNLPFRMLLERGYKKLILVHTTRMPGIYGRDARRAKLLHIYPPRSLGTGIRFTRDYIHRTMEMGYREGMKALESAGADFLWEKD